MSKHYVVLGFVVLLLFAGCLGPDGPGGDITDREEKVEEGLKVVNFTALNPELSPGDTTQLLLRLQNGNEKPVRNIAGSLSNTNPLTVSDEVTTTLPNRQKKSTECRITHLDGVAEAAVGDQVDCLWTVTVPDDVDTPLSIPVTATIRHIATIRTPAVTIQFKDESRDISTDREQVSVENGAVKATVKTRSELPRNADIVEIGVAIANRGPGDFRRDPSGIAKINLSYHGSLTGLRVEDGSIGDSEHAEPCRGQVVLEGERRTFVCSIQLTEDAKQDGIIHDLALELSYAYRQTVNTRGHVPE